jgi:tRNA(Ile)-lysidine synthase
LLSAARAEPLSQARIDALLAPLAGARATLIAVSGGPDSTALVVMAAEWASRRSARVFAATVDHRLRAESAAEAAAVSAMCDRLGVPHATLVWTGAKPSTRLMERAREARYRLLVAHAHTVGAEAIATAHHADDQAETVLFRLMRGSGVTGLAGMAATSERDGVILARPLLGIAKADLVAFCRTRGVAFVEDASNTDPAYARTRLRALMGALADEGLDAEGFVRLARRAAEADDALERMTKAAEARLGDGRMDARALVSEPIAVVQRLLARRIAAEGGKDESRIGLEKIEALAARLRDAVAEGRPLAANVGGALVRLRADGGLGFDREPPRRPVKRRAASAAGLPGPISDAGPPPGSTLNTPLPRAAGKDAEERD